MAFARLGAVEATRSDDERPMQDRLWSAYLNNLSSLRAEWFPRASARNDSLRTLEPRRLSV
jgi:hypothetical protein